MKTMLTALTMVMMLGAAPAMAEHTPEHKAEMKAEHYMMKIDTNKDGMISEDEHEDFGEKMFMEADTNKDVMISKDELKAQKLKEMEEYKDDKMDHKTDHKAAPKK